MDSETRNPAEIEAERKWVDKIREQLFAELDFHISDKKIMIGLLKYLEGARKNILELQDGELEGICQEVEAECARAGVGTVKEFEDGNGDKPTFFMN